MAPPVSGEEPPKKKRKRGIKNEKLYKRNEVRVARLKGQPYVSYTGKRIEGKTIPRAIVCKCRSKCHSKLREKNINEIWNHFYSIDNKNAQDTHLQNWIEVREIKRRKRKKRKIPLEIIIGEEAKNNEQNKQSKQIDEAEQSKKMCEEEEDKEGDQAEESEDGDKGDQADENDQGEEDGQLVVINESQAEACPRTFKKNYTFIYNVRVNGRITQICKNAFLQVFGVTESRIRRICDLLVQSKIPCDLRGKNRSVNTIDSEIRDKIHNHILQFEVRDIYHEGKLKKYLDPGLNIVKMHDMFIKENPEFQSKVKYSFYYQYFKENFDYEFGQAQLDVCHPHESVNVEMADSGVSDDNENLSVAPELLALKQRAKDFYEALKNATENKDYDSLALAFNYLQNFLVPHQAGYSYNNYYHHQDPNMVGWSSQNHQ